ADVHVHGDWDACWQALRVPRWLFTTKASRSFAAAAFQPGDALVFGSETAGLPATIREAEDPERLLRLPMQPDSRSLNLSNSVAVAVYEAWRQHGFVGGKV
ncbi:MAG: TrmH family RNA methyltransferase, partial [Pseudomonadota bacterium]